jgi:S1-C subfamily serine protease
MKNINGDTKIVKNEVISVLGAKFEEVSASEKRKLGITNGLKIVELNSGKLMKAGLQEQFIITHINRKPIYTIDDIQKNLNNIQGGVYIEGVYPNGMRGYYAFGL